MGAEQPEPPYPVLATQDLVKAYSTEHFKYAIQQCRDVIARVIAEDNSSEQQIARVRILRYLDLQLRRAVRWAEDETDLMASVVRSLIEIEFWADYVSVSNEQARQFLEETNIDAREMVEALHAYARASVGILPSVGGADPAGSWVILAVTRIVLVRASIALLRCLCWFCATCGVTAASRSLFTKSRVS